MLLLDMLEHLASRGGTAVQHVLQGACALYIVYLTRKLGVLLQLLIELQGGCVKLAKLVL